MSLKTEKDRMRQATENVMSDYHADAVEQQARAVARYYEKDEETWRDYLPLLIAVEEGRLKAVYLASQTPEAIAAFEQYMRER